LAITPDRDAVQPRQRGDDRAALPAPDLEHRVPVHDAGQDLARVVDLAAVTRDGVFQPVVGAIRVVGGRQHRRGVEHAARQVAQEALHLGQRVGLVHRLVVHQRALAVHQVPAQGVLVDGLAIGLQHHMGPRRHHLRLLAHHHRKVRGQHLDRALPGAGAQRHADHRHGFQQLVGRPARVLGDLGAADLHQQLDAAAGRIHQADDRHAQLVRQAFDVDPLVGDRGLGRAGADREVVHVQRHLASLDAAGADDGVGRVDALEGTVAAVVALAGQAAEFAEAAVIQQGRDAFARIEPAAGLELGQGLGAAHGAGLAAAKLQFSEFRGPVARRLEGVRRAHFASSPSSATSAWVALSSSCR
jgi:hypothetical protein